MIAATLLSCLLGLVATPAEAGRAGAEAGCGWPIRPACCGSLKCELTAWPPECRHSPPLEGEACTIFSGCKGSDLYCKGFQDGVAGRCTAYSRLGEACDGVFTLCGDGLKCRQDSRDANPNSLTIGSGRCVAEVPAESLEGGLDWRNDDACLAVYSPSVHRDLPASQLWFGDTHAMAFGSGWAGQAGAAVSAERGGIYGDDGSFACYRQQCTGAGILGVGKFVAISEYEDAKVGYMRKSIKIGIPVLLVLIGGGVGLKLSKFESGKPWVRMSGDAAVLGPELVFQAGDAKSGLDRILVESVQSGKTTEIWSGSLPPSTRETEQKISLRPLPAGLADGEVLFRITAEDRSWNGGNVTVFEKKSILDTTPPRLTVLGGPHYVNQRGRDASPFRRMKPRPP